MSARIPAVTGALLIALLVPASAAAATMEPLKPCYVGVRTPSGTTQTEGIAIKAAGFAANSKVNLTIDGQPIEGGQELQTDKFGNLNLPSPVPAPFATDGTRDFPVTLTQVDDGNNTVTATAKTTQLGVSVKPSRARPSQRIRFKGNGFTGDAPVYAHYVFKNKVRKTVRMVRKTGTCGGWLVHKKQIPVKNPKPGLWIVQFDQSKRYIDATKPESVLDSVFVRLQISVTLVRT